MPLLAAGLAGAATLGFEVVAARLAAIQLGSSLFAWAVVLALFLTGLAIGNALFAGRASRSIHPMRELGAIESAAALALAIGMSSRCRRTVASRRRTGLPSDAGNGRR